MDLVATRLRQQMRHIERINRRISLADLPGKVIPGSQDMGARTLRLDLGRSADGRMIKSPPVRWQEPGAGLLKMHSQPKDDEQMRLRSPSGSIGSASLADWSTYDDDNAPPSRSGEEAVFEFGENARITMRKDRIELKVGATVFRITDKLIRTLGGDLSLAANLDIEGERLTHNGRNVGSTHVHPGVRRGSDQTDHPE